MVAPTPPTTFMSLNFKVLFAFYRNPLSMVAPEPNAMYLSLGCEIVRLLQEYPSLVVPLSQPVLCMYFNIIFASLSHVFQLHFSSPVYCGSDLFIGNTIYHRPQ